MTCGGQPRKVSLCCCRDCQRRTGSAISIAAFYERAFVSLTHGAPRAFTRPSASGYPVIFRFCPDCGSSVFWEPARMPHLVGVAVGAFADPDFPAPDQAVWTADRHGWLRWPDDLPCFEANPPVRPTSPPA